MNKDFLYLSTYFFLSIAQLNAAKISEKREKKFYFCINKVIKKEDNSSNLSYHLIPDTSDMTLRDLTKAVEKYVGKKGEFYFLSPTLSDKKKLTFQDYKLSSLYKLDQCCYKESKKVLKIKSYTLASLKKEREKLKEPNKYSSSYIDEFLKNFSSEKNEKREEKFYLCVSKNLKDSSKPLSYHLIPDTSDMTLRDLTKAVKYVGKKENCYFFSPTLSDKKELTSQDYKFSGLYKLHQCCYKESKKVLKIKSYTLASLKKEREELEGPNKYFSSYIDEFLKKISSKKRNKEKSSFVSK